MNKNEKEYWDNFYRQQGDKIQEPSSFAHFCLSFFPKKGTVCDLGCGNGRDAFHFAQQGYHVIAIDQSETAIKTIKDKNNAHVTPLQTTMSTIPHQEIEVAYSRFSFHSIEEQEEEAVLDWAQYAIKAGGLVCIEVRSDKDSPEHMNYVFGKDHFRRHLNFQKLQQKLTQRGFHIEHAQESKGLAVYKDEDPVIIRLVARKKV